MYKYNVRTEDSIMLTKAILKKFYIPFIRFLRAQIYRGTQTNSLSPEIWHILLILNLQPSHTGIYTTRICNTKGTGKVCRVVLCSIQRKYRKGGAFFPKNIMRNCSQPAHYSKRALRMLFLRQIRKTT